MNINVLGYGTMGKQIAGLFYLGGHNVTVWNRTKGDFKYIAREVRWLEKSIGIRQGGNVTFVDSLDGLGNNVTIESVIEDKNIKRQLYKNIRKRISKPYFSSSSSYEPGEIGERVHGLHFFNPISLGLVELCLSSDVDKDGLEEILTFLKSIKFNIINVKENRGYIGNFLFVQQIALALQLVEEYGYDINTVREVYKGLYNKDIVKIIDTVGIDILFATLKNLKEKYKITYMPKCLKRAMEINVLGKKNGTSIKQCLIKAENIKIVKNWTT